MVDLKFLHKLIRVVLYFAPSNTWKIGDFGLTTAGTTNQSLRTPRANGTACYRGPELIQEDPSFTNKVDILAMGCILYELISGGKRLFLKDWDVREHYAEYQGIDHRFSSVEHLCVSELGRNHLEDRIEDMLAKDRCRRPSARDMRMIFASYRYFTIGLEYKNNKKYEDAIDAFALSSQYGMLVTATSKEIGNCYMERALYHAAAESYETAVSADEKDSSAHCCLANALEHLGKYDAAIAGYAAACELEALLSNSAISYVRRKYLS